MRPRALLRTALFLLAGPALAHPGWGIVVDAGGAVFYTDLHRIWRIGADGAKTVAVPDVHSHELYLDPAGVLHGEHLWYDNTTSKWGHYLWKLVDGKVIRHPPREGFRSNESFVRDRGGTMYWLEGSRVRRRAPDGVVGDLTHIPRPAERPGEAPGGILAAGAEGVLYLISGGDLLRVVTTDGRTTRLAADLDEHVWTSFMMQPWHYVMGLAADPRGNVYVANAGARKLKKVSPDGIVSVVVRASFPWAPTGIAFHAGEVYVLEYTDTGGSVRVRKVGMDGRVSRLP